MFLRISLSALIVFLHLLAAASAHAADPHLENYPLRVHVFSRHVHHNKRFGSYSGYGRANLIEGDQIAGMEFTYDCLYKFLDSESDEYYPAKWKHPGLSLEIRMGVIGSDTRTRTCEFQVALKEYVFRRVKGQITTMSPQEYAALDEARAERAQSLAPLDLDPSHYPVEFALLHISWSSNVSAIHTGSGQGNIRTPTGLSAVDFSLHCPVVIQPTPEGRYLLGRWLEPGTHLLLLLRSIDVDGAPGATCDVTTVVEPDVYIRSGGNIKAISQEEYRTKYASSSSPSTE